MPERPLFMLRIEVDGHFHGGEPVRPWVARIGGPDQQYGLQRDFVRPLNDWGNARKSWRGNVYGIVATFPLRDSHVYEVSRTYGSSSKRHVRRTFHWLEGGELQEIEPEDALKRVHGGCPGATLRVREIPERTLVTDLSDMGPVAFVVDSGERLYWLREGYTYDVRDVTNRGNDRCRLIQVQDGSLSIEQVRKWPEALLQ